MNNKKYPVEWQEPNYSVHISDIASSKLAKIYNKELSPSQLDAVLYLYGLDVNRENTIQQLDSGTSMRSAITGNVFNGGYLHVGYQRVDKVWLKSGIKNLQKYLYTEDGVNELIKILDKENVVEATD
jgi:hypothetical protein